MQNCSTMLEIRFRLSALISLLLLLRLQLNENIVKTCTLIDAASASVYI